MKLSVFTQGLVGSGFRIIGGTAVFSVTVNDRTGEIKADLLADGKTLVSVKGQPEGDHVESGRDVLELIAAMEEHGHIITPISGNQFRVEDTNGNLAGEFLIAPHRETNRIVLQACSASPAYRKVCEEIGVAVKDFDPKDVEKCLEEGKKGGGYHSEGCCW